MTLQLEKAVTRVGAIQVEASFSVAPGERAVLVGRSGSGKTTLLRLLAGLVPCVSGKIVLGGKEIQNLPIESRGVGMVFQDQALFPALDVLSNVAFGLKMQGVDAPTREATAREWLSKIGLADRAKAHVSSLSGGEKQRVAFARALACRPQLLLLDEPFSALDTALRSSLRAELVALHQEARVPLVLVTHDPEDARAIATRVIAVEEQGPLRRFVDPG